MFPEKQPSLANPNVLKSVDASSQKLSKLTDSAGGTARCQYIICGVVTTLRSTVTDTEPRAQHTVLARARGDQVASEYKPDN